MANVGREAVRGLSGLRRAFKVLPDVVREALADATEETAERIRAGAVRRVPVRYGFLRDAIAMRMNRRTGMAKVGIEKVTRTSPDGAKTEPRRYAHLVEFGSEHNGAQPFMIPSAEEQRSPYLQRAKAAGTVIERDMSRVGVGFD